MQNGPTPEDNLEISSKITLFSSSGKQFERHTGKIIKCLMAEVMTVSLFIIIFLNEKKPINIHQLGN